VTERSRLFYANRNLHEVGAVCPIVLDRVSFGSSALESLEHGSPKKK
jgi:hypothetical protein